eukprot:NODE_3330_length_943_cov_12.856823_g2774_i0.p1 GENE.NODE_3330_length_943_cov_12.856823_g2774_i0~~NODE_3330_length_943_cov_12.856823_g2774_i0.p1  ORF type:complete len:214 (+),score=49.87 NODE_3330_length_943_cov_12.856823_g2774_i0:215-856(+)
MAFVANAFRRFFAWLQSKFWQQDLEMTIVGLQHAGKTTLLNVLASENFSKDDPRYLDTIPTQGLNTRKVTKGNVNIKLWDIGGQQRFRQMWWRYCRGVDVIVFVVDAHDEENIPTAKDELHELLSHNLVQPNIPVLVLGNKNDLPNALTAEQLIASLDLNSLGPQREVCCYSISCKNVVNIDITLQWLLKHAKHASSKRQAANYSSGSSSRGD